jgi:hypothetical protein
MDRCFRILVAVTLCAALPSSASALQFSFANDGNGSAMVEDLGGVAGFSETITFWTASVGNGSLAGATVDIGPLTLDETIAPVALGGGVHQFVFSPTTFVGGFELNFGPATITGDLTPGLLTTFASGGIVGSTVTANITGLSAVGYVAGTDPILDGLLNPALGGGATVSFNVGGDLHSIITSGSTGLGSYSGTVAVVPLPSTLAMIASFLPAGLLGAGFVKRRNG